MSKICFGLLTAHVHSGGSDFKNNDLHLTFLLKPRGAKYVQTMFTKAHHSELGLQRQLYVLFETTPFTNKYLFQISLLILSF